MKIVSNKELCPAKYVKRHPPPNLTGVQLVKTFANIIHFQDRGLTLAPSCHLLELYLKLHFAQLLIL